MAFTYFFRDLQTLELIVRHLIPAVSGRRNIRIWDAGCASGQEPYTLAILLSDHMNTYAFRNIRILATDLDISNQFADIIKEGIYPREQLQRIPPDLLERHFTREDDEHYRISDRLRAAIEYRREDLLTFEPPDSEFSLILCKNVLLHQSPQQRVRIVEMFHNVLSDRGLLAMEHTQKLPKEHKSRFNQVAPNAQLFSKREQS